MHPTFLPQRDLNTSSRQEIRNKYGMGSTKIIELIVEYKLKDLTKMKDNALLAQGQYAGNDVDSDKFGNEFYDMEIPELDGYSLRDVEDAINFIQPSYTYDQAIGRAPLPDGRYLDKDGNKTTVAPNKDAFTKSKFDRNESLNEMENAKSGFNDPERTGGFRHLGIGRGRINEQTDPEQKAYEVGLKRLQKAVIQYQIKYIDNQRKKAISQAAIAGSEAGKGFDEQIDALRDQIKAIDNPEEEQNEGLLENYIKSRKNTNLMTHMDLYKQATLLEGTMKKLFDKFNKGETNEEVLSYYAKKGISMPETFLSKARKHYENVKKQKLEIGFMEQEAKDIITIPTKVPNLATFDLGDDNKKLAKGIYQEKK